MGLHIPIVLSLQLIKKWRITGQSSETLPPKQTTKSKHNKTNAFLLMFWRYKGPCIDRWLKKPRMSNTHGSPLNGGDKIRVFLARMLGVDFVLNLLTFLLSVEADLTHLWLSVGTELNLIRHNDYSRLFPF